MGIRNTVVTDVAMGFVAGASLGGLYFGALWLTVRRIPDASRPGLLVLASYLVRLGLLGVGMYGVVRLGGGGAIVAALVGLLAVRHFAVQRIGSGRDGPAEGSTDSPIVPEKI